MPENGLTIHYQGESGVVEFDKKTASDFWSFLSNTEFAPRPGEPCPFTEEEVKQRHRISETYEQRARTFAEQIKILADLRERDLAHVFAFVDLIRMGDSASLTGSNWALEVIRGILMEVQSSGAAGANETPPLTVLASVAYDIGQYWSWIYDAQELKERHPALFPAPAAASSASAEPPASERKPKRAAKRGQAA